MGMISVREYANPQEMIAHARALHRKTWVENGALAAKRQAEAERRAAQERAEERARKAERERLSVAAIEAHRPAYEAAIGKDRLDRNPRRIIERIAEQHGIAPEAITGPSRYAHICHARFAAVAAVREANTKMSLPALAVFFNRDHTTILNALRKAAALGPEALATPKKPWIKNPTRAELRKAWKP